MVAMDALLVYEDTVRPMARLLERNVARPRIGRGRTARSTCTVLRKLGLTETGAEA
jgi:hypothetical protein